MKPSLNGTKRQKKLNITLPDELENIARLIGNGQMSKGIRIALIYYALEHQKSLGLDPDQIEQLRIIAKKDKHHELKSI